MRYFTSDLHLAHPFVAATRGFIKKSSYHGCSFLYPVI